MGTDGMRHDLVMTTAKISGTPFLISLSHIAHFPNQVAIFGLFPNHRLHVIFSSYSESLAREVNIKYPFNDLK